MPKTTVQNLKSAETRRLNQWGESGTPTQEAFKRMEYLITVATDKSKKLRSNNGKDLHTVFRVLRRDFQTIRESYKESCGGENFDIAKKNGTMNFMMKNNVTSNPDSTFARILDNFEEDEKMEIVDEDEEKENAKNNLKRSSYMTIPKPVKKQKTKNTKDSKKKKRSGR